MTEEEAKTKWCPMVRASISQGDHNASNRGCLTPNDVPVFAQCIGSKCMMWRAEKQLFNITRNEWIKPKEIYMSSDKTEYRAVDEGYCGLAGKP